MNEYALMYERVTAKRDEWKARAEAAENKLANAEAEIEELRAVIRDLNAKLAQRSAMQTVTCGSTA